jgi:hypothetical protein
MVVGEVLADDTHTATPPWGAIEGRESSPPVVDVRVDIPLHVADPVGATSTGDVRATTTSTIIDVDPINARPPGLRIW